MSVPESRFAQVGDLQIHYHDVCNGAPDSRPTIVFLHGSGPGASSWSNFKSNYSAFVAAGYRVILADAPGFGKSSKPADAAYALDFHVGAIVGLIDSLGLDEAILVGNSMGGAIALNVALNHPRKVSRLILLAPGGLGPRERYAAMPGIRSMFVAALGEEGPTPARLRETFELQLYDKSLITEQLIAERHDAALTQPRAVYLTANIPDMSHELQRIACPVLGFWGVDDNFCPFEHAALLATRIPDCRVVSVNRCGHWVQTEKPQLFNQVSLAFLAGAL